MMIARSRENSKLRWEKDWMTGITEITEVVTEINEIIGIMRILFSKRTTYTIITT